MDLAAPPNPELFHIVHVDRLPSILTDGGLLSDAQVLARTRPGTTIGMRALKNRRLEKQQLSSHPGLFVGQCVPLYFCPRSIMLYMIYCANHAELAYRGGQGPIVHLEFDLLAVVAWAHKAGRRWAFTLQNASASYFQDRARLDELDELNWEAIAANKWAGPGVPPQIKEGKQAEFLVEEFLPWHLVRRVGTGSPALARQVLLAIEGAAHRPPVEVRPEWYYP